MIELLKRFAANGSDPREYMRAPFSRGEWTYATNGHIAVRVPKIDGVEILPEKHIPRIEGLFKSSSDAFIDMPILPQPENCQMCNGTGIAHECPDCDGDGEFEHGLHTYKCKECDGSGQVTAGYEDYNEMPCRRCAGTGVARFKPVQVGVSHFDLYYLILINGLPGLKFSPGAGRMDMAYFMFDGGDGILMPMNHRD